MSRHNLPFRFKQFEVSHHRSSMKVGIDAVILGAWADVRDAERILDIGCGCGVIALMCAQRNPKANIVAIDIDEKSIIESEENFAESPWSKRLKATNSDFYSFCNSFTQKYDYLISNPPYFDSGLSELTTRREKARHQGVLSPEIIIRSGKKILSKEGRMGLVLPIDQLELIERIVIEEQLWICRKMIMTGREGREAKRAFIEIGLTKCNVRESHLCVEHTDGSYTDDYRNLCKDFYLKF